MTNGREYDLAITCHGTESYADDVEYILTYKKEVEDEFISRLTAAWQGPPEQLQYYIAKMKGVE